MASFTDELLQYTPYVSQIPLEAYVNTGVALQGRYDQNVQKIQGIIDQVNGLPVVGEANVAYLKQKMGELQQKVQGVVSSDFSRGTLVNQINSMAGQIAKDPNIQASMLAAQQMKAYEDHAAQIRKDKPDSYSEANYQRGRAEMQKYLEASKSMVGLSYQGPSSMVIGTEAQVKKRMFDMVKELDPDASVTIDNMGSYVIKTKNKALTPEKIKTFVQGQLTADDMNILSNAAWFNFQGAGDDAVAKTSAEYYLQGEKHYGDLAKSYREYAENTTGLSKEQKAEYLAKAKYYSSYAEQYGDRKNNIVNGYKTDNFDRDQVTSAFWMDRTLDGFSMQAFSQTDDIVYEISPDLQVAKTLAEIDKMRKDAKGGDNDKSLGSGITPASNPIIINPDDPRMQRIEGQTIADKRLDEADKAVDNAYIETFKSFSSTTTASGASIQNPEDFDQYGNLTKAAEKRNVEKLVKMDMNYRKAALSDDGSPIEGFNENNLKIFRDAKTQVLARNVMKDIDDEVTKVAKERLKARGQKIDLNDPSTYEVGGKRYTIKELKTLFEKGTREATMGATGMGAITNAIGGTADNSGLIKTREVVPGTEFGKLSSSQRDKVRSIISDFGKGLKEIDSEKEKIYRERSEVNQPILVYSVTSDKDAALSNNKTLQAAFTENLDKGYLVGEKGNASELIGKLDMDKVQIKGAYWNNGKLYMRASATIGSGEKAQVKTIDVDISDIRKSYPQNGDWFYNTFVSDSHPHLTEALLLPGSKGRTPFDPRNNTGNNLMVVGANNIARYYSIEKTSNNTFAVRLNLPTGDGNFTSGTYLPDENGKIVEFPNAGMAIQAADLFYKNPNARQKELEILGNGK